MKRLELSFDGFNNWDAERRAKLRELGDAKRVREVLRTIDLRGKQHLSSERPGRSLLDVSLSQRKIAGAHKMKTKVSGHKLNMLRKTAMEINDMRFRYIKEREAMVQEFA